MNQKDLQESGNYTEREREREREREKTVSEINGSGGVTVLGSPTAAEREYSALSDPYSRFSFLFQISFLASFVPQQVSIYSRGSREPGKTHVIKLRQK